jgi:ABC-type uncharacterized transport system permease subunit
VGIECWNSATGLEGKINGEVNRLIQNSCTFYQIIKRILQETTIYEVSLNIKLHTNIQADTNTLTKGTKHKIQAMDMKLLRSTEINMM